MKATMSCAERDSRFIPAHHQPALLVDIALERGIDSHRLLRGTGLFVEEIVAGTKQISPGQCLTLIANAERLLGSDDTSFRFGQRLLPGHYGAVSHALQHAADLHDALTWLATQRLLLCPLLTPRLRLDEHTAWLYWHDSFGAGEQLPFLLEATMTAVAGTARWLARSPLPWTFHLRRSRPRHIEQYWVHLGDQLRFDQPLDAMSLPREWLVQPWPDTGGTAARAARSQAERERVALGWEGSLLDALFDYLHAEVRRQPQLETTAQHFGMSAASLKRRLHKHGTHFQAELDRVRTHVALWLYRSQGYSHEAVAAYLGIRDAANYRRSFKRWTGLAPGALPARLAER